MNARTILGAAAVFFGGMLTLANAQIRVDDLICTTSDGVVRISTSQMTMRDYVFSVDRVLDDGTIVMRDARCKAYAEIDARSDEGLYIAVQEGGITMQVIAPRRGITLPDGRAIDAPASPAVGEASTPDADRINVSQQMLARLQAGSSRR